MSEKAPNQASSKEDLDQLSALEESMASFGMGDLDSEHGVILKDWSAQDFANIYVRFRPHLISHARKFLREETQAEEVVQDAFLYLMTALPELDSELGVLRFLKWKIRFLSLDVLKRDHGVQVFDESHLESAAFASPELSERLEAADDAAIVRLALSQLSARHRQAIIASVFEEKSSREAALEMGLTENAFRQLLLRARKAFKVAFVGEAEVRNLTVSEALRIASKRHGVKVFTSVATFLVLAVGLTGANFPAMSWIVAHTYDPDLVEISRSVPAPSELQLGLEVPESLDDDFQPNPMLEPDSMNTANLLDNSSIEQSSLNVEAQVVVDEQFAPAPRETKDEREIRILKSTLASNVEQRPFELVPMQRIKMASNDIQGGQVFAASLHPNTRLVVEFGECLGEQRLTPCKVFVEDSRNDWNLIWLSTNFATAPVSLSEEEVIYEVVATDFLVGDFGGTFGNISIQTSESDQISYLKFKLSQSSTGLEIFDFELLSVK